MARLYRQDIDHAVGILEMNIQMSRPLFPVPMTHDKLLHEWEMVKGLLVQALLQQEEQGE